MDPPCMGWRKPAELCKASGYFEGEVGLPLTSGSNYAHALKRLREDFRGKPQFRPLFFGDSLCRRIVKANRYIAFLLGRFSLGGSLIHDGVLVGPPGHACGRAPQPASLFVS